MFSHLKKMYCRAKHIHMFKNILIYLFITLRVPFRIPWSQLKTYFLFKLDKVMEDFHASAPEERDSHIPNVEYIPFEEMKKRILKIVDGYNGWVK